MSCSAIDIARQLLGDASITFADTHSGGNSRLVKLVSSQGRSYAMKQYPDEGELGRRRLDREQAAFTFFADNGFHAVPRQLAVDRQHRLALVEWVEGHRPATTDSSSVDAMVAFLSQLHHLRDHKAVAKLGDATDAVFSLDDLLGQLQRRIDTFEEAAAEYPLLQHYLQSSLIPAVATVVEWVGDRARKVGVDHAHVLEQDYRTLSPSDFGSHNMLKTPSGYSFIDFEYFGWDDPAKLIGDFVWRPEPKVDAVMKQRFADALLWLYGDDPMLESRYHLYGPLLGLCWGLIVLNPLRREWAQARGIAIEKQRAMVVTCIDKSKMLVSRVSETVGADTYALNL
ncbi:MAG: aminoglycoside phosphotransferase family protein [Candidatus Sedimenticola sp. (ex Thyasira tokunagai)]